MVPDTKNPRGNVSGGDSLWLFFCAYFFGFDFYVSARCCMSGGSIAP